RSAGWSFLDPSTGAGVQQRCAAFSYLAHPGLTATARGADALALKGYLRPALLSSKAARSRRAVRVLASESPLHGGVLGKGRSVKCQIRPAGGSDSSAVTTRTAERRGECSD